MKKMFLLFALFGYIVFGLFQLAYPRTTNRFLGLCNTGVGSNRGSRVLYSSCGGGTVFYREMV